MVMFGRISVHRTIEGPYRKKSFRKLLPVHYFEKIGPGMNHCDWLILVVGPLDCFSCVIKSNINSLIISFRYL